MLKTIVRGRATGKTTEVIVRLRENKELIALVPTNISKKLYPSELQSRIFTPSQLLNGTATGMRFTKLLIVEGFVFPSEQMVKLYYYLGENHIDVEVYGTI